MRNVVLGLTILVSFAVWKVSCSETKTIQELTEEQLFDEVSESDVVSLSDKQTVHVSPRHVLPKKKKVKKYKKRVKHNYPSSDNEGDIFLSSEIDEVFSEEGERLKRGGKAITFDNAEEQISNEYQSGNAESGVVSLEAESPEHDSLQLEIQLEKRKADTDSYDDYDEDYLPEYTGHKPNSKTAAADGEVVAIPIDNIHIEYIEKNSGEGLLSGKALKRSPSSQLDKLPEYTGHLPENVQTEYDAGGLWDVDTVDVIRNFRQTELGLKVPFNYILESNSVQPDDQFKENISDEEFFINKNGGNTANSNSNSGGQQFQQQVTARPVVQAQTNAPFTAFTSSQIQQFNNRPFSGIQSFTPAGGSFNQQQNNNFNQQQNNNFNQQQNNNFNQQQNNNFNSVENGIVTQQGSFQQTNAALNLAPAQPVSNHNQVETSSQRGVLINTPDNFGQRIPGIGSFTPPGGRPTTPIPAFSTTTTQFFELPSTTRPPVVNSPRPSSNQFRPAQNQGLNFQGSGEFQQVNVQDFNQGINKFNTPSSTNRPTNNGQLNQNGGQFNQNGGQFNQNGGQFNQNGGQLNQNGGQFNQLQQRPSGNQFNPRPEEQFRSQDNTVSIGFSDLDTQNLLVNSAEVIDLFDVNDHIPNVPTQQPIIRRPTPTTRLNVPLNNQNTGFSAVFPGNSVQPAIRNNINTLNGQIVPVNTNNGFNNGQNAGVFQQGGFPGNSVNPPSTENINQFTSPSIDSFSAPSPLTIPGRGNTNSNLSFQPAQNDPNIGGFFDPASVSVRRPQQPPPNFQGRPQRPRRSNILTRLAQMIG